MFEHYQLEILDFKYGKNAWSEFEKLMGDEDLTKCNEFTRNVALQRKEVKDAIKEGPEMGTPAYDKLRLDDLVIDMQRRFRNSEVSSLFHYMELLQKHNMENALITVL